MNNTIDVTETAIDSASPSLDDAVAGEERLSVVGSAFAKVSNVAQQAKSQVTDTMASLAVDAGASARGLIDEKVRVGADMIGNMARSVRAAADALQSDAPELARWTRTGADRVDQLSTALHGRSARELMSDASEFTRRNPAAVFGSAALVGFLFYRTIKSASSVALTARPGEGRTQPGGKVESRTSSARDVDQYRGSLVTQNQPG